MIMINTVFIRIYRYPILESALSILVFSSCASHHQNESPSQSILSTQTDSASSASPSKNFVESLLRQSYASRDWDHFFGLLYVYDRWAHGPESSDVEVLRTLALLRHCRFEAVDQAITSREPPSSDSALLSSLQFLKGRKDLGVGSSSLRPTAFSTETQWTIMKLDRIPKQWRLLRMKVDTFCHNKHSSEKDFYGTEPFSKKEISSALALSQALMLIQQRDFEAASSVLLTLYERRGPYWLESARLLAALSSDSELKSRLLRDLINYAQSTPREITESEKLRWIYQQALLFFERKRYQRALDNLDLVIAGHHNLGLSFYWRGFCLWRLKRYSDALASWLQAKSYLSYDVHHDLILDIADHMATRHPNSLDLTNTLSALSIDERYWLWSTLLQNKKVSAHWYPLMKMDEEMLLTKHMDTAHLYFQLTEKFEKPLSLAATLLFLAKSPRPLPTVAAQWTLQYLSQVSEDDLQEFHTQHLREPLIASFLKRYPDDKVVIHWLELGGLKPSQVSVIYPSKTPFAVALVAKSLVADSEIFLSRRLSSSSLEDASNAADPIESLWRKAEADLAALSTLRFSDHFDAPFVEAFLQWQSTIQQFRAHYVRLPTALVPTWNRSLKRGLEAEVLAMKHRLHDLQGPSDNPDTLALFDKKRKSIIDSLERLAK